jgi:hypothetical protein
MAQFLQFAREEVAIENANSILLLVSCNYSIHLSDWTDSLT